MNKELSKHELKKENMKIRDLKAGKIKKLKN